MFHPLVFEHEYMLNNQSLIRTRLNLYEKVNYVPEVFEWAIGYYDLDTDMNGECLDDWLVITDEKAK